MSKSKKAKSKEERQKARREVMSLLREGIPYRRIEAITGMNSGSISRIKKSKAYEAFCKETVRAAGKAIPATPPTKTVSKALKEIDTSEYDRKLKTDRFIQAVGVGGIEYAMMYARCTLGEVLACLDQTEIAHHAAKPRIAILGSLLRIAHDTSQAGNIRIKAATEWWRLASGQGETPLINIDARSSSEPAKKDPVIIMMESVKSALDGLDSVDLMGGVQHDATIAPGD